MYASIEVDSAHWKNRGDDRMINSRKIGAYISKLRKEKDLTQVELADKLNISHQAISKWERGESPSRYYNHSCYCTCI
jgi:DNA-binding XRE family transcriptional regulator